MLLVVLVATYVLSSNRNGSSSGSDTGGISNATSSTENRDSFFPVEKVIDGDTIDVIVEGRTERIRLIGIDTPEAVDPRKPVQCFGTEASRYAAALLTGTSVRLEADATQGERDAFGRLLRYLFLSDGTNVNERMIREGYAHEYTYDTPYRYQARFRSAEVTARDTGAGLWAPDTCNGETNT